MDHFQETIDRLSPMYGAAEAKSLVSIIFEDVFHIKGLRKRVLDADEQKVLNQILEQLLEGVPLQYILGVADFFGMKIKVTPAVLIPRQETEELVAWCIDHLKGKGLSDARILDVGTGSGCIALALQRRMPGARVVGADVSHEALEVARANAELLNAPVRFEKMDALDPSTWMTGPWDLIVSNPPYVTPSERKHMPAWVTQQEPDLALFVPEEDPLLFYRKLAEFAQSCLQPNGCLAVEINEFRAVEVQELFREFAFGDIQVRADLSGAWRMAMACK